ARGRAGAPAGGLPLPRRPLADVAAAVRASAGHRGSVRVDPDDALDAGLERDRLGGLCAEPLGHARRGEVVRVDERDQALDPALTPPPFSYRTGSLGRVAAAPVLAHERPAELRLRVPARVGEGRVPPDPRVPHDHADPAEERTVLAPLEHEMTEAVRLP